jgi:hypothetical protein
MHQIAPQLIEGKLMTSINTVADRQKRPKS